MRSVLLILLMLFMDLARAQTASTTLPTVNQDVLAFVHAHLHKKVGHGECWDLAAEALDHAGATWDHALGFGRVVDPKREPLLRGDIVQFEGVEVSYAQGAGTMHEHYAHHTAIIEAVKSGDVITLAHQNTGYWGRKVGLSDLSLPTITKGMVRFYRPVR